MARFRATLSFPATAGEAPLTREFTVPAGTTEAEITEMIGQFWATHPRKAPKFRLWRCDIELLEP